MALGSIHPSPAQGYGEQPLRQNLGVQPYFRTEEGREKHRFADAEINRYRLYDFYRRQADHHRREPAVEGSILPPYPGLDGGRRGHWGGTNEKHLGALRRKTPPEWPTVLMRGGQGLLHVHQGGWMVFDTLKGGFSRAMSGVQLGVAEHPFGFEIDRFGNRLDMTGTVHLAGSGEDWKLSGPSACWFAGHHHADGNVLLQWQAGGVVLLEKPEWIASAPAGLLSRTFEVISGTEESLVLRLPTAADGNGSPLVSTDDPSMIRQEPQGRSLRHRITVHHGETQLTGGNAPEVLWKKLRPGSRLQLLSWCGDPQEALAAEETLRNHPPQGPLPDIQKGGPARHAREWSVRGTLNADPAASDGNYQIDDIPVPFDHPENTPMTFSGIGIDTDGVAYLCTLVGDVWRVSGLHGDLSDVRWKRFASGLDMPMGLAVVDGVPHVHARRHIIRLIDSNEDGEADHYLRFNRMALPDPSEAGRDLGRDDKGRLVFNCPTGIFRISADGGTLEKIGDGARNPLGLGVRGDGLALSDSSEGNLENGTCTIYESAHPENSASIAKRKRLVYLPRGIDNSPGSRIFMNEPRFGPLGRAIVGVSYGNGSWYSILRDEVDGTPQAAVHPLPGAFASGACRLAVQPLDGQVIVTGLDGWGDYAVTEGCLHRIRYTGRDHPEVIGWRTWRNGLEIEFSRGLRGAPDATAVFVQQWNYIDSAKTYGSAEVSARDPAQLGHDRLRVDSTSLLDEGRLLRLVIPELHPAMCTQIRASLRGARGETVELDLYATLQNLGSNAPWAKPVPEDRPRTLEVPTRQMNGDTNQKLVEHFDRLAGRETTKRPVAGDVKAPSGGADYAWIRQHLIDPHCLVCHGPGTQHDFSTHAGVRGKLRIDHPQASPLYGMIHTGSMPPYPLPSIPPGIQSALLDWISRGAPE